MEPINLTDEVMNTIEEKDIKIKPRVYFVIGTILLIAGVFSLFLISILFANFCWQHMRVVDPFGYLVFGPPGILPFFQTFPWLPLITAATASAVGLTLLKKYDFAYKYNFVLISLSIIVAVFVAGIVIDETGINEHLHKLPPARPFLRHQFTEDIWVVGEITAIDDPLFPRDQIELTVLTPDRIQVKVIIDKYTALPGGLDFVEGDRVRIIGEWRDDHFYASGIDKDDLRWKKISILPSPTRRFIIMF